MPTLRKSFIIHKDSLSVLDELSSEQAGLLFKAMKAYQNDEEIELDSLTKIIFSPFKAQFDRDNEKYKKIVERNKNNGLKGGRPKTEANPENPDKPSGLSGNPENPSKADSVSKNDSKNDSKSDSDSKKIKPLLPVSNHSFDLFKYWCDVMGKSISTSKLTPKREKAIKARLKEGYTIEQIKSAIDGCRNDPFSMGQNDRQKPFNDIELICRTGEKVESFLAGHIAKQGDINSISTNFDAPEDWNNE
tara:strand:+ start:274 stop:1014 length:741 start_codon:yes stop_codon:yes gene_type:complete